MIRIFAFLASFALLAACGATQMNEAPEDLGEFKMRVGYVYTDKAKKWPTSRDSQPSEWNAPLERALQARLGRYNGSQEYDVAISLEGFLVPPGGIPVLVNPKGIAVVNVFVYDVANKAYLIRKHQMQIFEDTTGESAILGSGHSRTKAEQIDGLALNVVDALEELMAEKHAEFGWFNPGFVPTEANVITAE